MPGGQRPKLRADLIIRELADGFVEIEDPRTRRFWRFDELQVDVLQSLAESQPEEIALELGSADALAKIELLIDESRALGLLEDPGLADTRALAVHQAAGMRDRSARLRDARAAASVRWARDNLRYYATTLGATADEVMGVEDLVKLPIMTKVEVRANFPEGLIHKDENLQDLVAEGRALLSTTSGSTGGRLQYVYDLQRAAKRSLTRHPVFADQLPTVTFTTPICNGQVCHRGGIPYEDRFLTETILQLNSSERILGLSRDDCEEIIADTKRHQARLFAVDPVYGAALVRTFRKYDLVLPTVELLTTGWEYLTKRHRVMLSEAFGLEPMPTYGATDIGGGAAVCCEKGRYHVMESDFVFEFVRDGEQVANGEIGEILITTLQHAYTRHIRYRVGDLGRPIDNCGCSFADWQAFEIEGRVQDALVATDGGRITSRMVDDLFEGLNWIDFYQLAQRSPQEFHLTAVKADDAQERQCVDEEAVFLDRLRPLLGDGAKLRVQYAREMPIEQSMKYPPTKWKCSECLPSW